VSLEQGYPPEIASARAKLKHSDVIVEWSGTIEHVDIGITQSGHPCVLFWLEPGGPGTHGGTVAAHDRLALWAKDTLQALPNGYKGLSIEADGPFRYNTSGPSGDLNATFLVINGRSSFVQRPFPPACFVDDSWCEAPEFAPLKNRSISLRRTTPIEGTNYTESGLRLMGRAALPTLIELASDSSFSTRIKVAELFKALGTDSLEPLSTLAGSSNKNARDTAEIALQSLLPGSLQILNKMLRRGNDPAKAVARNILDYHQSYDDIPY
jgi:hypothetical protein